MPYNHIDTTNASHPTIKRAIERADNYLLDVYCMLDASTTGDKGKECFAFSIALVLLCVIDGISRDIYPTQAIKDQDKRFKKLIRDKLYWPGDQKARKHWADKAEAANQLYLDLRNPMVHQLAGDDDARARKRSAYNEPVMSKWGKIPKKNQNIETIEAMETWNEKWPTMYIKSSSEDGRPCLKLCLVALYWSVKKMLIELANDQESMSFAGKCQDIVASATDAA